MRKDIPFYNYEGPPLATPTTQHHRIMGYIRFNENAWLDFRYYTFFAYVLRLFVYQFTLELPKWPYFNYIKLVYSFLRCFFENRHRWYQGSFSSELWGSLCRNYFQVINKSMTFFCVFGPLGSWVKSHSSTYLLYCCPPHAWLTRDQISTQWVLQKQIALRKSGFGLRTRVFRIWS